LKDPALTREKRLHYLDIIETESKRLSKLSDNLLKLSSLESDAVPLKHALSRLDQQIEAAVLMLEPQWAEKDLLLSLFTEKTTFVCDGELLTQVWVNLLHNAIKFTPPKGAINISLKSDENALSCTIADSGIGIAAEDRIHLFERFYKVDKSRDRSLGGNGLGLSLVKKIVELHEGSIELRSEVGKGTAFTVRFPKES
jgi:signal transduction histidine kinase